MATYSSSASEQGVYEKTLVASTVDTVTVSRQTGAIQVVSDGTASIYFTLDGTVPTVGMQAAYLVPAVTGGAVVIVTLPAMGVSGAVVKLISAATPKYSVSVPAA